MSELRTPTLRRGTLLEPYPYQIVDKLGEDSAGMSRLFLAEHLQHPHRSSTNNPFPKNQATIHRVVIKIADLQKEDGEFTNTALQGEELRLKTLNHPNIIRLLPVAPPVNTSGSQMSHEPAYSARAELLRGKPWFIVLEYLSGGSLAGHMKRNNAHRLLLNEVYHITLKLAGALQLIHATGGAHLDLKPANIVFRSPPKAAKDIMPVLIDFGISEDIGVTPRDIIGTPEYMAPEHISGSTPISAAMDTWSLGVIFYQMLTGQHPFGETINLSGSTDPWAVWQDRAETHTPAPPSQMMKRDNVSRTRADKIDRLALDMLAKQPEDRPAMDEISSRVRNLLDQYPTPLPPIPVPSSESTDGENQKWKKIIVALLLLAGLIMGGGGLLELHNPEGPAPRSTPSSTIVVITETPPATDTPMPQAEAAPNSDVTIPTATFTPMPPPITPGALFATNDLTIAYMPGEQPPTTSFFMMDTEATIEQYSDCVDAGMCEWPIGVVDATVPEYRTHPMSGLTPVQMQEFAEWVGGRLPTDEEWRWACQSGDENVYIYPWGGSPQLDGATPANVDNPSGIENVASYPDGSTPFNLFDMTGNVAEWTIATSNGDIIQDLFKLMGGSYDTGIYESRCVAAVVCTIRNEDGSCRDKNGRQYTGGFRVAWSYDEKIRDQASPTPSPPPTERPFQPSGLCFGVDGPCKTVDVPASNDDREEWMCIKTDSGGRIRVTATRDGLPIEKFDICIHDGNKPDISAACKNTVAAADPNLDEQNSRTAEFDARAGNTFQVILRNDSDGPISVRVTLVNADFTADGCQ